MNARMSTSAGCRHWLAAVVKTIRNDKGSTLDASPRILSVPKRICKKLVVYIFSENLLRFRSGSIAVSGREGGPFFILPLRAR
jgi:hypothetical protein